jgi:outer membrane protein TolC
VAIGIPADLLRRRPDVRRAERSAAAQSARIGIAESDFYPRIVIAGDIGWASSDFADLFSQGSFAGEINPGFTWNLLNYGRIQNNVRAQAAEFYQLVYEYQNTVLRANLEAEDALVRFLEEHERIKHLNDAVEASKRYRELVQLQYEAGEATSLALVDSERLIRDRQDDWAESRGDVALHLVALYRALGGGWAMRYALGAGAAQPAQPFVPADQAVPLTPPAPPPDSAAVRVHDYEGRR